VDLSESNERLELENRKLKVAAIGLTRQLRDLDATIAPEFNVTGLGVPNRAETDAAAKRAEILKAGEDDASTTRRDGGGDASGDGGDASGDGGDGGDARSRSRKESRRRALRGETSVDARRATR
jgi:hypothetical protein